MADPNAFKLNLTRNRTKKWQDAKQVNYGGDDWGEDEYDEYDSAPPPMPSTLPVNVAATRVPEWNSTQTNPPYNAAPLEQTTSGGRLSFDENDEKTQFHSGWENSYASNVPYQQHRGGNSSSQQQQPISSGAEPAKPLPFVRPADIYKRMEEEKEKERRSQDSSRPSFDSVSGAGKAIANSPDQIRRSEPGELPFGSPDDQSITGTDQSAYNTQPLRKSSSLYSGNRDPSSATSPGNARFSMPPLNEASPPIEGVSTDSSNTNQHDSTRQSVGDRFSQQSQREGLQHQPSTGYTAVVHKAFDIEAHDSPSPSTTTTTLPRTSSVSTSALSPILGREHDILPPDTQPGYTEADPSLEGLTESRNRPESTSTIKPDRTSLEENPSRGAVVAPGFRRDSKPPSPGNGPARQPLSIVTPPMPQGEQGLLSGISRSSTYETIAYETPTVGEAVTDDRARRLEVDPPATSSSRSASEDYHDWKEQRRSFHAKHGLDNDSNASPVASMPGSRSGTPTNSLVPQKEIVGRSAAVEDVIPPVSRPEPQDRLESFRPSLPGGWQSDMTITNKEEHVEPKLDPPHAQFASTRNVHQSTDSIPTAKAPRNWQSRDDSVADQAFAAAAAAGTAMAGSFSGSAFTRARHDGSSTDTDDESYRAGPEAAHTQHSDARDFAMDHSSVAEDNITPTAPQTLHKAQPSSAEEAASEETSIQQQGPDDFPAPLRMSKLQTTNPTSQRSSFTNPTTVSGDEDPEQLQYDIVKSLTPDVSNVDLPANPSTHTRQQVPAIQRDNSYTAVLPDEYSQYWRQDSVAQPAETVHEQVTEEGEPDAALHKSALPTTIAPVGVPAFAVDSDNRPALDQRFSWENAARSAPTHIQKDLATIGPPTQNVNIEAIKAAQLSGPERSTAVLTEPTGTTIRAISPEADVVTKTAPISQAPTTQDVSSVETSRTPVTTTFPTEKVDFQTILGFNDPRRRIVAFDENRRLYSESNGLLDHWLASLNIPEHADVFITSRQVRAQPATPQAIQTTPRREATAPSGTKQIQEDGKRILAVAGKYGGKAKGLFTKGKDKFRTASSSDKGPQSASRKSTGEDVSAPTTPSSQRSVLPTSIPPQLPTPTLNTPVEEVSWSLISSTIDQIFNDSSSPHPRSDAGDGRRFSQLGIQGELTKKPGIGPHPPLPNGGQIHYPSKSQGGPVIGSAAQLQQPSKLSSAIRSTDDRQPLQNEKHTNAVGGRQAAGGNLSKALPNLQMAGAEKTAAVSILSVDRPRRPSEASDVSEIGEIVSPQATTAAARAARDAKTSPQDPDVSRTTSRSQEVRIFLSHSLSKEAEARQDAEAAAVAAGQGSLPPYSSPIEGSGQRVAPGTQIVPIVNLREAGAVERRSSGRPFSFMGTETMSSVPPYQMSQPEGQSRNQQAETKRSEPDITQHPAYRQDGENGNSDQPSAANPLPSSRRPPEEIEDARRRSRQPAPVEQQPEGWRIPGPYKSELRSLKPRNSVEPIDPPSITPTRIDSRLAQEAEQSNDQEAMAEVPRGDPAPMQPLNESFSRPQEPPAEQLYMPPSAEEFRHEPHTRVELMRPVEPERSRNLPFGNFFRNRSSSRNREERGEHMLVTDTSPDDKKKRRPFFRINNRPQSPVPRLGGLPEESSQQEMANPNGHRRMMSSDMVKPKNFGMRSAEGKKRRISGLAGLFSRSNNREKGRSSSAMSQRSDYESQGQPSQPYGQYAGPQGPAYQGPVRNENFFQYPQGPMSDRPGAAPGPVQDPRLYNDSQRKQPIGSRSDQVDPRPDNLWVNTISNSPHNIGNALSSTTATPYTTTSTMPVHSGSTLPTTFSTSPPFPVTRAHKDMSYGQDRPYIPPSSPANMADHVKNLNKRSRSPRLGKPSSDEHMRSTFNAAPGTLDIPDPAQRLGTFFGKKASPIGIPRSDEEQEKPWTLTLPSENDDADERGRTGPGKLGNEHGMRRLPVQGSPEKGALVGAVNASDALNKVTGVAPESSSTIGKARDSREVAKFPPRIDSRPVQTDNKAIDGGSTQTQPEKPVDKQDTLRSVAPSTNPPISLRNYTSKSAEVSQSPPTVQKKTINGDTIQTTTRTTNGPQGVVTSMRTSVTTPKTADTLTPVERPPSVAPNRSSQARSPTPLQSARSPTPSQQPALEQDRISIRPSPQLSSISPQKNKSSPSPDVVDQVVASQKPIEPLANRGIADGEQRLRGDRTSDTNQDRPISPLPVRKAKPKVQGDEMHPSKMFAPVELPGSKPDGYESEDEPVMSATFFPGQDWQPAFGEWEE